MLIKNLDRSMRLLSLASCVLLACACQGRSDYVSPEGEGYRDSARTGAPLASTSDGFDPAAYGLMAAPEGEEGQPGAPADEAEGYAEERRNANAVEADRKRFLARQLLEQARVHIGNYEYTKAARALQKAQEMQPGSRDIRNELRNVNALLGRRTDSADDYTRQQASIALIKEQEQRARTEKLAEDARIHLANGHFDDAVESYEQALFIITASPYDIEWGDIKSRVENGLRDAKYMREQQSSLERQDQIEKSLEEMARMEEDRLWRQQRRLEQWMGAAIQSFERGDFEGAISYSDNVLQEQPDFVRARELKLAATRARHEQTDKGYLREEKRRFREWLDDINNTRIPQDKILRWPSQSFWEKITRLRKRNRATFGKTAEIDAAAEALKKRIAATNVNLNVEDSTFKEVVDRLQVTTGLNFMIDARIAADVSENPVTGLVFNDVALDSILNLLTPMAGEEVVWTTQDNVIKFTSKEYLKANLIVQIHTVADLTNGLVDFIPPKIQLVSPDDVSNEEEPLFGAEDEELKFPYGSADDVIELIRNSVEPSFWGETDGADIQVQGEHTLVVKATPEMQEKVDRFLNDLRGFAGIVVTVKTRFLEVGDNFLRDVGIDFRGLDDTGAGTLVNLDDVTNGLEDNSSAGRDNNGAGLPVGAALSPSAGAFFNDGGDGDFRARTENIFDRPLGNVLSAVGGATLTLQYLDDTEVQMVVRATEKDSKTRTLTAPTITVHNTQRANLTVVNQLSYIQDFDVEVAQTAFIADPIVGIIQDGLTLDVRPTVSNDRRYVTLELQPTVADLVEPIPTFATSLAAQFSEVVIQLPELRLQQARTTVRIPNKGSILIGGLKNIRTVDRSSQTPFLADIPILSFLFSREGRSDEVAHLMILVSAEITDLRAEERRRMGER